MVLHPSEKSGQQTLGKARVRVTAGTRGGKGFFDFVNPHHDGREFLRELERFVQAFFAFADVLIVKRASVEAHEFDAPLSGDGARGHALAASLHAGNQYAFRRHEAEALTFRSQRTAAFINPLAQTLESRDIGERGVAANSVPGHRRPGVRHVWRPAPHREARHRLSRARASSGEEFAWLHLSSSQPDFARAARWRERPGS